MVFYLCRLALAGVKVLDKGDGLGEELIFS
jgi:hypothetical protein